MTKRSIHLVNFQDLDFCQANSVWIVPQAFQLFKNIVQPVRGTKNLFSFQETANNLRNRVERDLVYWEPSGHEQNLLNLNQLRDLMKWSLQAPRGQLLGRNFKQGEHRDYSAIQPFGLWPALKERNQTWKEWDLTDAGASLWLDQDLLESIHVGQNLEPELLDPALRLDLRERALQIRTGSKAGTLRDPNSTATVYNCPELKLVPRLLKLQLLELWLYQPGHSGIPFLELEPLKVAQPTLEVLKVEMKTSSSRQFW